MSFVRPSNLLFFSGKRIDWNAAVFARCFLSTSLGVNHVSGVVLTPPICFAHMSYLHPHFWRLHRLNHGKFELLQTPWVFAHCHFPIGFFSSLGTSQWPSWPVWNVPRFYSYEGLWGSIGYPWRIWGWFETAWPFGGPQVLICSHPVTLNMWEWG